ncbi:organic hydroperoxide resistance protein [Psychrobacter sp. HD31]|uniref:organic hydroperoxide resistance protein n=1 Tax=Psychrobacter sp. HD31 TaxID=3112003 RepID=UPI003DA3F98A
MSIEKVLYTAEVNVTGGRENGAAKSDDGQLDIALGQPKALGGDGVSGSNPEQLFAAGYAACFIGAMRVVAMRQKIDLPEGLNIDSKVSLGAVGQAYGIAAELVVNLPGLNQEVAEGLVNAAHQVCPYSNATRGNIDVKLSVVV